MATPNTAIKFTYQDYLNTPEDKRYELIDGELILAAAPRRAHQDAQLNIGAELHAFMRSSRLGKVITAPRDLALAEKDTSDIQVVQPDLMFISSERLHIDTETEVRGAPDLVVEILSPSTAEYDKTVKRTLYARHGVREYWQVDTDAMTITVLLLGDYGFEIAATYGPGDTLISPTLPGFSLAMDEDLFS